MASGWEAIPAGRRDAVQSALASAFGARPVGDLRLLSGGVSGAGIWRGEVSGGGFVLRLEPERIALRHRQRHHACLSAAAAVGVAPAVRYADPAAGVAIMDFVDGRPLSQHPGGRAGLAREMGSLIARLQTAPPFPPLDAPGDPLSALLTALEASALFAPGALARHAEALSRIRAVHPWTPSSLVPSHNDPNPRNVLFDGRRVWLVDWELAAGNDPLFDLAILTTELADTPELEDRLVAAALGRPTDAAVRARLALVRRLTRLFYGCIALEAFAKLPASARPPTPAEALTPAGFRAAVGAMASSAEIAWAFGSMSLRAFVDGLSTPTFAAELDAVS
jgi:hypothetical protein